MLMKLVYRLETHKILRPALYKIEFLLNLNPLIHYVYFFSIAWLFGIIHQNIQRDSLTNEVYKF